MFFFLSGSAALLYPLCAFVCSFMYIVQFFRISTVPQVPSQVEAKQEPA
jgi:hypothetical protein